MTIRVLHIFSPNYKYRFGGPIFDWKYAFSHWDTIEVEHKVLDHDEHSVKDSVDAFNFEISNNQVLTTRNERTRWIFFLIRDLIRYKQQYDILHFHVLWWGGLLACTWAKWNGIPTVYQSVLFGSDTPNGVFNQRQGKFKEKLLENFSGILAISDALAEEYLVNGFPEEKIFTLMNSVDLDVFHPVTSQEEKSELREKNNLPQEATILIFTGSLIERKGVDILLKGFTEAGKMHNDLYLLLVGPGSKNENASIDEEFIGDLKRQICDNVLQNKIRFTGLIKKRSALADLYRCSDCFVFPSRSEGLPNVVLEAMACGLPVIVSDLPGLKHVIKSGENGLVIPPGVVQSLTQAINYFKETPSLANQLGKAAFDYIVYNHSFAEWQTHLVAIYKCLNDEIFSKKSL